MKSTVIHRVTVGNDQLEIALPEDSVDRCSVGEETTERIEELLRGTLDQPLSFPPLSTAFLDDDHVAIAVEDGVPRSEELVCELVDYLNRGGLVDTLITVVIGSTNERTQAKMKRALEHAGHPEVQLVCHSPQDQNRLEYIAASETADAIYIQRDIAEAAVVIPVYCVRHTDAPNAADKYGMSPAFADANTQHRWNLAWLEDNSHNRHLQSKLSHEAGWLMGIQFAVAVVPARNGEVHAIFSGSPDAVFEAGVQSLALAGSKQDELELYDLAIAIVEGDSSQQSWMNVARAVANAEACLNPSGRVVVCCDVQQVTPGIHELASDDPDKEVETRLLSGDLEDAFAAAVIRDSQTRRSIYLYANLPSSRTESLGLAHISNPHELERLCQSVERVCLIRSAQF